MSQTEFSPICVNLDGHTIRVLQLRATKPATVAGYAYSQYLQDTTPNRLDVSEQLKKLNIQLAEPHWGNFVGNKVIISLPGISENEQVKTLAFAHVHELDSQLQAHIADESSPQYFTHLPLNQYIDSGGNVQQSFLIRSQPAILHHYLTERLSEQPYDSELVSATASLGNLLLDSKVEQTIVVHMGVLSTKVIGLTDRIESITTVPVGFEHILQNLSKVLSLERQHSYKAMVLNLEASSNIVRALNTVLKSCLTPLAVVVDETIKSLGLDETTLVVLGDGARVAGLAESIAAQTNTKLVQFDPWSKVASYPLRPLARSLKPVFSLPLSMALASLS
ncbi:hypothetical protein HYX70_04570 [Candidatus Saccharibacteria bacterium]|nr:hypothetical protein [Candidatus Saccharibacteria bacterium]